MAIVAFVGISVSVIFKEPPSEPLIEHSTRPGGYLIDDGDCL